jgi:hypothetical protein
MSMKVNDAIRQTMKSTMGYFSSLLSKRGNLKRTERSRSASVFFTIFSFVCLIGIVIIYHHTQVPFNVVIQWFTMSKICDCIGSRQSPFDCSIDIRATSQRKVDNQSDTLVDSCFFLLLLLFFLFLLPTQDIVQSVTFQSTIFFLRLFDHRHHVATHT